MNKLKMNYERRVRYYLSATLLSSLFLFPPTYVHATSVHGQEAVEDEDKDVKTSVTVRVVSELSQEPCRTLRRCFKSLGDRHRR